VQANPHYQLHSAAFRLGAGVYSYSISSRILNGAISVGVVDTVSQRFVVTNSYRSNDPARSVMLTGLFGLSKATEVELALSNGAPGNTGLWALRSAVVGRIGTASGEFVKGWSFTDGLPHGWKSLTHTSATARGLEVRVGAHPRYQLYSPALRLGSGDYRYSIKGRILSGVMSVGIVDTASQRFIHVNTYHGPSETVRRTLSDHFRLPKPTSVEFVLSNAVPTRAGRWVLRSAYLARAQ
jgi:hypothetical protein